MTISFFVPGIPRPQPRPRAFARKFGSKWQARVYNPASAESWKSAIAAAAQPYLPECPINGPIKLTLAFLMPRPKSHFRANLELKPASPVWHTGRPDRDNLVKAVCDCLTQIGMWKDDSQVCDGNIRKEYSVASGLYIDIETL